MCKSFLYANGRTFLSFRALSANVEHPVCQFPNLEMGLGDAGSLDSRSQDILICGDEVVAAYPADSIEVAGGGNAVSNYVPLSDRWP